MDDGLKRAVARAEALISAAVHILHRHAGEDVTIGLIHQMAEEQARLASLERIITAVPESTTAH